MCTKYWLTACKKVWLGEPAMTIAVDLGRKATKQTNKVMTAAWIPNFVISFLTISHIQCETSIRSKKYQSLRLQETPFKNVVCSEFRDIYCLTMSFNFIHPVSLFPKATRWMENSVDPNHDQLASESKGMHLSSTCCPHTCISINERKGILYQDFEMLSN